LPEYLVEFDYTYLKNYDNKLIRIENDLCKNSILFIWQEYLTGD